MDSVNLDSEEWISVINNVINVLKMWFGELPSPLLISGLHRGLMVAASEHFMLPKVSNFSQAAGIGNGCLWHVRLRERDNYLPRCKLRYTQVFFGISSALVVVNHTINV